MEIYEITGYPIGRNQEGVNFLEPSASFETLEDGYIYRQVIYSRQGFSQLGNRLGTLVGEQPDNSRVMGIFNFIYPDDTKQLLVITKNYLYYYDTVTNQFNQAPNSPAVPFGMTLDDAYISGTTYPTASNGARFLFTSSGMTDIYAFDGTTVTSFSASADYAAPTAGALTKAKYICWFGERLNLFCPEIDGVTVNQQVLYSGIRTTSGNGDKFNVPGSGTLSADTYNYITGITIPGDYILANFNQSNWTLEKTRDAFNPYFWRKIPSVIGTNADFSAVAWNNTTESLGMTGVISSDGRTSLRTDNQIPYFTVDEISQQYFNYTYGGFDRVTSQYLYAYRSADSQLEEITQDKVLVHNYEESTWSVYNMRFSCFGQVYNGPTLSWDDIDENIDPSWGQWDTTEEVWDKIGIGIETQKTLAGDNQSFVYQLNVDYDDYFVVITNITQASSAVITVNPCALQVGDEVYFEDVQGMTEINGLTAIITAINTTDGATTEITVNVDSSGFTAYTLGGSVSKLIKFYAKMVPFNPYRAEGRRVYVSHVEFLLNTNAGEILVDLFEDEEESPFKANVLVRPDPASNRAREWITVTVGQESNFISLAMKQSSVSQQVQISSIRIHCSRGGYTSA